MKVLSEQAWTACELAETALRKYSLSVTTLPYSRKERENKDWGSGCGII